MITLLIIVLLVLVIAGFIPQLTNFRNPIGVIVALLVVLLLLDVLGVVRLR